MLAALAGWDSFPRGETQAGDSETMNKPPRSCHTPFSTGCSAHTNAFLALTLRVLQQKAKNDIIKD